MGEKQNHQTILSREVCFGDVKILIRSFRIPHESMKGWEIARLLRDVYDR